MTANQAMREMWNTETQTTTWPRRERFTVRVTPVLLEALALRPGENVLEVGSGGGLAAIDAARAVAPNGSVTGFDLSAPLVGLATQRAAQAKVGNVRFVSGDAQTDAIPGGPFDVVMSQFGVMFFDDPTAAFSNVRKHMRPGARMAFACWQPPAKNPWSPGPILAKYAPPPAPSKQGGPPPGPFAFADIGYVKQILTGAGLADVSVKEVELEAAVPQDSLIDREMVDRMGLDKERAEQAWAELQSFRSAMLGADGLMHLTLAPQIVRAKNPG